MSTGGVARVGPSEHGGAWRGYLSTVLALTERDARVVRRDVFNFVIRSTMQPALFAFVFAYVFPHIGQGIGSGRGAAANSGGGGYGSVLLPGLVATTLLFQGVFTVALPLVQEFSYSREIEDRAMAPIPIWLVGLQKVLSGAVQGLLSAVLVVPIVWICSGFDISISWSHPVEVVTISVLGAFLGASFGLMLGTVVEPRRINLVFSLLILPLSLLGCVYYPWSALSSLHWLQVAVLVNPVVYMAEGLRAALTPGVDHLPLLAVYGLIVAATVVVLWLGLRGFTRRVLS